MSSGNPDLQESDGPCLGIATRQALRCLLPAVVQVGSPEPSRLVQLLVASNHDCGTDTPGTGCAKRTQLALEKCRVAAQNAAKSMHLKKEQKSRLVLGEL